MKKILSFVIVFLVTQSLIGQTVSPYSLTPDWYVGNGTRIQFPGNNFITSADPSVLKCGANTSTSPEASTSISFKNGNVALFSNSMQVYDGTASGSGTAWTTDIIAQLNSSGLNICAGSSTGAAVMFPDPASPTNAFYMVLANDVTSGGCANKGVNRIRFTGTGTTMAYDATHGVVNIAADAFAGEAITCGTDGVGGYWVVIHDKSATNNFRVFHFLTDGTIVQLTDQNPTPSANVSAVTSSQSYLKISPCQNKIAYFTGTYLVVYDWNRSTGAIGSELRRITPMIHGVGLEFSPDGNRVYYSGQNTIVKYLDIATGTSTDVTSSTSWSMQLGNNGKIYASPAGSNVGVIADPNGSPSWSTVAIPSGGTLFRGLANIAWLSPETPSIPNPTISGSGCTADYSHLFQNYFQSNVGVTQSTFNWNFGDGNTATNTLNPSHTYTASGTYNVTLSFNDAYCAHTWNANRSVNINCTAMPLVYLNFSAHRSPKGALLKWITSSEKNNKYFIVQHSTDGISFDKIGVVQSKGNSSIEQHYSFVHDNPSEGSNYYRLVQYDDDGSFTYSKLVNLNSDAAILTVVPNPSTTDFRIIAENMDQVDVEVYDLLGKLIHSKSNTNHGDRFGEDFPTGTYIVKFYFDEDVKIEKIIKR